MGVKVVDFKGDGNAWIVVHDPRLPKRRLRKYVGRDWKAAELAASQIRVKLAANDLSFLDGDRSQTTSLTLKQAIEWLLRDDRMRPAPVGQACVPSPRLEAGRVHSTGRLGEALCESSNWLSRAGRPQARQGHVSKPLGPNSSGVRVVDRGAQGDQSDESGTSHGQVTP